MHFEDGLEELNRRGVTHVRSPHETAQALVTFTIHYVTEGLARVSPDGVDALVDTLGVIWYRAIFSDR